MRYLPDYWTVNKIIGITTVHTGHSASRCNTPRDRTRLQKRSLNDRDCLTSNGSGSATALVRQPQCLSHGTEFIRVGHMQGSGAVVAIVP